MSRAGTAGWACWAGCASSSPVPASPAWPSRPAWPGTATPSSCSRPTSSAGQPAPGLPAPPRPPRPRPAAGPAAAGRPTTLVEATAGRVPRAPPAAGPDRPAAAAADRRHRPGCGRTDGSVSTAVDRGTLRAVLLGAAVTAGCRDPLGDNSFGVRRATRTASGCRRRGGRGRPAADLLVGSDGAAVHASPPSASPPGARGRLGGRSIVGRAPLRPSRPACSSWPRATGTSCCAGLRTGVGLGLLALRAALRTTWPARGRRALPPWPTT